MPGRGIASRWKKRVRRAVVVGLGRHDHQVQPGPRLHEAEAVLEADVERDRPTP